MMGNIAVFLVLLAAIAVFGWLAARTSRKWLGVTLVGLLSMVLVLGFLNGLTDMIQLYSPASNPVAIENAAGAVEPVGRSEEFARFCEDCHSSDRGMPVRSDGVAVSSDTSFVFVPPEIFPRSSIVDAQEIVAYSLSSGPDLKVVVSNWSEVDFIQTIRMGKDPQGHALDHRMPWRDISAFSTDDNLKTYYAFLRGLTQIGTSAR